MTEMTEERLVDLALIITRRTLYSVNADIPTDGTIYEAMCKGGKRVQSAVKSTYEALVKHLWFFNDTTRTLKQKDLTSLSVVLSHAAYSGYVGYDFPRALPERVINDLSGIILAIMAG